MSRNVIFVLMYHCHKLLDLINLLYVSKITGKGAVLIFEFTCDKFNILVILLYTL
jgi:hypothetical protein